MKRVTLFMYRLLLPQGYPAWRVAVVGTTLGLVWLALSAGPESGIAIRLAIVFCILAKVGETVVLWLFASGRHRRKD